MVERRRFNNWGTEYHPFKRIEEIQHFTTAVEAIVEVTARTGRKYKTLEFIDPEGEIRRASVWIPGLIEGLVVGEPIEIHLEKKGAFWNLGNLIRLKDSPKPPIAPEATTTTPELLTPPDYSPRAHLERIESKLDRLLAVQEPK